jgi:GNAT superfamily N-acetyltransferase
MTATDLTLRSAAPTDANALATLLQGIGWFRAYAQNPIDQSREAVRGLLRSAQDDTRSSLWVAQSEALGLCGYCAVHWLPVAVLQGWEAYVSELFVADAARGQSVGARLLDTAVQAARDRGCQRIWLVNNRDRPSYTRGFYRQQGWQEQPEMARFVLALQP